MPILINVVAFRLQSADVGTTVNVGQTVSNARTTVVKRNHGYGVNTGNYSLLPSAAVIQDNDFSDSPVAMPFVIMRNTASD